MESHDRLWDFDYKIFKLSIRKSDNYSEKVSEIEMKTLQATNWRHLSQASPEI